METSAICVVTHRPCGSFSISQSRLVSAIASAEISHIATLQPSATSWRASSRPMPVPPPVMTAVFPANSFMGSRLPCSRLCPVRDLAQEIWPRRTPQQTASLSRLSGKVLDFSCAVDQPQGGAVSQMRKIGLKALTAVVTIGRRSKKHVDWTLVIAIFSTIVTLSLVALYVLQDSGDF
jgi:hypothetical protein